MTRAQTQNGGRKGKGKVVFLHQLEEIQHALDVGCTPRDIWEVLYGQGQMPISLRTFRRYVSEFGGRVKTEGDPTAPKTEPKSLSVTLDIAVPLSASGTPQVVVRSPHSHEAVSPATEPEPVTVSADETAKAPGGEPTSAEPSVSQSDPVGAPEADAADALLTPSTSVEEPRHAQPKRKFEWNPVPDPKKLF